MQSQASRSMSLLQGTSTQPAPPVMLRGQTKSELEAAIMRACQEADPEDTGSITWQVRQHHQYITSHIRVADDL